MTRALDRANIQVGDSPLSHRNLIINGESMSVDIKGSYKENVEITILKPNGSKNDFTVMKYNVVIPQQGYINFVV